MDGRGSHWVGLLESFFHFCIKHTTRKDWFTGNLVRTDSSLFGCVGTGRARAGRAAASRQSDQNRHTEHTEQLSPPSSPVKSSVTSEHF